jgi:hypothetical protein
MKLIKQNLILDPHLPRTIPVQRCQTGDIAARLKAMQPRVLGVAIQVSAAGHVKTLAFSTSQSIYAIDIDVQNSRALSGEALFVDLLAGATEITLAGFDMAAQALYLYRHLGLHVQGVDLSTTHSRFTNRPCLPSEVVGESGYQDVMLNQVDKLWDILGEWRELCLRAWISARLLFVSFLISS